MKTLLTSSLTVSPVYANRHQDKCLLLFNLNFAYSAISISPEWSFTLYKLKYKTILLKACTYNCTNSMTSSYDYNSIDIAKNSLKITGCRVCIAQICNIVRYRTKTTCKFPISNIYTKTTLLYYLELCIHKNCSALLSWICILKITMYTQHEYVHAKSKCVLQKTCIHQNELASFKINWPTSKWSLLLSK